MRVIIREIYDSYFYQSQSRSRPSDQFSWKDKWQSGARATIHGCELNYFPLGEAYSSSLVAEEQKRHPFWFLLFRTLPLRTSFMLFRLNRSIVATIHRLSFFPFFFLRNAYTRSIRGDESPLVSIQTCKRSILFEGWPLFFLPSAFADKFPPLLALSDSSAASQAKWNIGNRKSSAPLPFDIPHSAKLTDLNF